MAKGDCILEPGPNSWLNLPNSLLSSKGKSLVTADPDLGDETLQMLRDLEKTPYEKYCPFYFSDEEKSSDIGMATLSMCIQENQYATMAELVARYADLRNVPYAHVAIYLSEVRKKTGFIMFVRKRTDNTFQAVPWSPTVIPSFASMLPPPKRSKAC